MVGQFNEGIVRNDLCKKMDRVLLAVSGGVDSMVMLHLFVEAGYQVGVAHCNFQLRDAASDQDEAFVQATCKRLHVSFYSKRFDTKNYAAEHGYSTQLAARKLRYDWFNGLRIAEGYDLLATAHHLGDNLETVLLNLVRGTGWRGLTGIPIKANGIIRPLLNFTRGEIEKYAKEANILWREDNSNASEDYDRNFIRHQVIPKLNELNPSLEDTFSKTLPRLAGAGELMTLELNRLKDQFCTSTPEQLSISKKLFDTIIYRAAILWELVKTQGFNYHQCEAIVGALAGQPGKKFLSATHQLTIDRDALVISKHQDAWNEAIIEHADLTATLGTMDLQLDIGHYQVDEESILVAHLDADLVRFPLIWRKWEAGDFFCPLGMDHRKKVSDFFIDQKLSLADKNAATVIESQGEIVWVVGYRIDNRFKITKDTKRVLQLRLKPHFT